MRLITLVQDGREQRWELLDRPRATLDAAVQVLQSISANVPESAIGNAARFAASELAGVIRLGRSVDVEADRGERQLPVGDRV